MGEGGQSPAQRPGSYNPAQEPSMGYYTFNAWNTIYSHTNPPLAERLTDIIGKKKLAGDLDTK